jgi:predicted metal-dependent phosphoesterase TrpH
MIENLDGFEILNGSSKRRGVCNLLAEQAAAVFGKPGVAGSDAHSRSAVARVFTRFDGELTKTSRMGDLIRSGNPQATIRQPVPVHGRS